jgi:hypothetical protein
MNIVNIFLKIKELTEEGIMPLKMKKISKT